MAETTDPTPETGWTLEDDAVAAFLGEWETQARAVLTDLLSDPHGNVSALTLVDIDVADTYTLTVFVSAGGTHLAVTLPTTGTPEVWLVEADGDKWVEKVQIESLAHLGEVLRAAAPPAWDPNGVAYAVDQRVSYQGAVYECAQAHVSQAGWYPGAPGVYLWTKVAA